MIQIRRFESCDAEAVKKLVTGIMDTEFPAEKSAFAQDDLNDLGQSYGGLGEAFFVAEDGQGIVGTIGVKREDHRVALLRRMFVAPEYRKKRIGFRLLDRAIEFCEEVGYQDLVFKTTSRMSGAIELMKKRGFQSRAKIPMGRIELLKFLKRLKGRPELLK